MEHMMAGQTIGAFEAKTRLSELLNQVARGREIIITRRGKPVARLSPLKARRRLSASKAVAEIKKLRKGSRLRGLSWKALRDEGRKW